jgi:hypothetical protein
MACHVETRNQARAAIESLGTHPAVVATDLLAPGEGIHAGWTVEFVCDRPVPPAVQLTLASNGLAIRDVSTQGMPAHYVVIATT